MPFCYFIAISSNLTKHLNLPAYSVTELKTMNWPGDNQYAWSGHGVEFSRPGFFIDCPCNWPKINYCWQN